MIPTGFRQRPTKGSGFGKILKTNEQLRIVPAK